MALQDEQYLTVVGVGWKADAARPDGNALSEHRVTERPRLPAREACPDGIARIGAGYDGGERRSPVGRAGRRDRPRRIANRNDVRMGDRSQGGIDENAADCVDGKAGHARQRRGAQPARPHA